MVTDSTMSTAYGTINIVYKTFSVYADCSLTESNSASCFPSSASVRSVIANAATAAVAPFCQWQCDCGGGAAPIRIDGSDDLPVELMGFSIEASNAPSSSQLALPTKARSGPETDLDTENQRTSGSVRNAAVRRQLPKS